MGREDAGKARFRPAAEMVALWRGLDLPAWEAPYILRDARLGYVNGYEEALTSGGLSGEPCFAPPRHAGGRSGESASKPPANGPGDLHGSDTVALCYHRRVPNLPEVQRGYQALQHPAVTVRPADQDGPAREGSDFDTHEVDLENKSEEFLSVSPTGKVPVIVVDGGSLYESNVINQFLEEVSGEPRLLPDDPRQRAHARIWMSFADDHFFPAVFVAGVGRERGFSEERISGALEKLDKSLAELEERLEGREYLAGEFSLADVAYAGNFVRLRELERRGEVSLERYPNVAAWMERIEGRKSYRAAG